MLVDQEVTKYCKKPEVKSRASTVEALKSTDMIITVGGDGTILRTIRRLGPPLRILSVNMGYMGFLCEVEPDEIKKVLDEVLEERYKIQRVNLLSARIGGVEKSLALNEVLTFTSEPAKVLDIIVKADDVKIFSGRADGVLISSSIGSTAYVVSLDGPLVDPYVQCLIVVVLNPLKLGVRPIILPANSKVEVSLSKQGTRKAFVYADGVLIDQINRSKVIEVSTSTLYVDFIRVKDVKSSFYRKFYEVRIRGGKEDYREV